VFIQGVNETCLLFVRFTATSRQYDLYSLDPTTGSVRKLHTKPASNELTTGLNDFDPKTGNLYAIGYATYLSAAYLNVWNVESGKGSNYLQLMLTI
jgi:hypothetical protein